MAWQYPPWSGDLVEPPVAGKPEIIELILLMMVKDGESVFDD